MGDIISSSAVLIMEEIIFLDYINVLKEKK